MLKGRATAQGRGRMAGIVAVLLAATATAASGRDVRLAESAERGTFNLGAATASVATTSDPDAGPVLTLDYAIPTGAAAGVWTKGFPASMTPEGVDVVRLAARGADPAGLRDVAATLEIKGASGVQRIPIDLHPDWAPIERPVDWAAIGALSEVVVSVNRVGDGPPAVGAIALDVRFERLPTFRRLATYRAARLGAVLLVALAAALAEVLVRVATRGREGRPSGASGLLRDVVKGAGCVGIAAVALAVYRVGSMTPLEVGWWPAWLAFAGFAVSAWWIFGTTGRHLTPAQAFGNALAVGLLATSSSPLAILQAPRGGSDLLELSAFVAAVAAALYLGSVAVGLATSGRHPGGITGALIVGTPYAIGALTLLEAGDLVRGLGDVLSSGSLAGHPLAAGFLGRVAVLFLFNEAVAMALGLATTGRPPRSWKAHLALLATAVAAVAGPWIAGFGSGDRVATWAPLARHAAGVLATILSQATLWAEGYLLTGLILDAIAGRAPTASSIVGHPVVGAKKGMVYSGTFMGLLAAIDLLAQNPAVQGLARSAPMLLGLLAGAAAFPLAKAIIETFDGSQAFFRRVGNAYRDPMLYVRGAIVGAGLAYGLAYGLPDEGMGRRVAFGLLVGVAAFAGVNLVRDALGARAGRYRIQPARSYLVLGLLGGFIGAAIGFYLDAVQVDVVVAKFRLYVDPGQAPRTYDVYPLLSKWGFLTLGTVTRGREPAVRRGPRRGDQLGDPVVAVRDQPHVPRGLLRPRGRADPGPVHPRGPGSASSRA